MGTFGADVGQGRIISSGVDDDGVAIWGVREKDNIGAQVGVDHAGTRFIVGRDVRSFAYALEHATYRVMPKTGSKSLGFGVTANLVVSKGVDFGGRERLPMKLEGDVGEGFAIRTLVLLTRGWSYLKEESASCNHCKVGVRKCGVSVSRDCGEGVGVTTVGVVQGGVSWVVGLFN